MVANEVSIEIYGLIYLFNPMSNLAEKKDATAPAPAGNASEAANPAKPIDSASAPPANEVSGNVEPPTANPGESDPAGSPEVTEPSNPPPADPSGDPPSDGGGS